MTPKVSYFTRMDTFTTGSTFLVFLALLVAILTGKLMSNGRRELACQLDVICRPVFPVAFLLLIAYSFWL